MALYAAVVHTMDEVQLLTAATSLEEVTAHVARYVRGRAESMLWDDDAEQVNRLLEEGRMHDAVGLYFSRVGERWDREFLRIERVGDGGSGSGEGRRTRRALHVG